MSTILAKARIINPIYVTSDVSVEEESNYSLDQIVGINRIKIFLDSCSKNKGQFYYEKYPYLIKYSKRYRLINKSFQLDEYGKEFTKLLTKDNNDNIEIISFYKKLFTHNCIGCGEWVKIPLIEEQYHKFEAIDNRDASYEYALFLYNLGIIEEETEWKHDNDGIFHCRKTNLGQELSRNMLTDFKKIEIKSTTNKIINDFSDNSINVDNSEVKDIKGGKNNA